MSKLVAAVVFAGTVLLGHVVAPPGARAEIGTMDVVPAATLLLPYFEVDLGKSNGRTTLFSVNNASATAVVAQVTVWTDWGIPSFGFQIYLTGYDVQAINMRDIFNGILPVTADAGSDPTDTLSPKGRISQDINFPGSIGPCGSSQTTYNNPDPTLAIKVQNLQRVHEGLSSPIDGRCWGENYGDQIARGYVTVDTVFICGLLTPADAGYQTTEVTNQNVLWGDSLLIDPSKNTAEGETLVHIEACPSPFVGNGAGLCPFAPGDYTFYGRYANIAGQDSREPLATTFAARFEKGKATNFLVWRDTKTSPTGANGHQACGGHPSWFPLSQTDVVGFDEQERPSDLCFLPDNVSPPVGGTQTCFPLATQRVKVKGANKIAKNMNVPGRDGWVYLNLNHTLASGDPFPGVAQAWVEILETKAGSFSTGFHALALDNATATVPGGVIFIP